LLQHEKKRYTKGRKNQGGWRTGNICRASRREKAGIRKRGGGHNTNTNSKKKGNYKEDKEPRGRFGAWSRQPGRPWGRTKKKKLGVSTGRRKGSN